MDWLWIKVSSLKQIHLYCQRIEMIPLSVNMLIINDNGWLDFVYLTSSIHCMKIFSQISFTTVKFVFLNNFLDVMNGTNCIEKSKVDSKCKSEVVQSNSADWIRSNRNIENLYFWFISIFIANNKSHLLLLF